MKKVYLGLLGLGMVGMLAACGGQSKYIDYVIDTGKSVVTDELVQANVSANPYYCALTYTATDFKLPEGYTEVARQEDKGVIFVEKDGKIGVYSLLAQKIIISPRFASTSEVTLYSDDVFGFNAYYQNPADSLYYYVDGVGNILHKSSKSFVFYRGDGYDDYFYVRDSQTGVLTLFSMGSADDMDETYYRYDANNVATEASIYDIYPSMKPAGQKGEGYVDPDKEFKFVDEDEKIDYTVVVYGSDRTDKTVVVTNNRENGEGKTFYFPSGYNRYFAIGNKLFFQRLVEEERDVKGKLTTKYIDMENLKVYDWDVPAYVTYSGKLNSVEGQKKDYYFVHLTEIEEDGYYGATRMMIVDEDVKFHDDITQKNFVGAYKLHNGYFFNQLNNVLYDTEFKPVFDASGWEFSYENEIWSKEVTNGYVLVGTNGKRLLPEDKYISSVRANGTNLNGLYSLKSPTNPATGGNGYVNVHNGTILEYYKTWTETVSYYHTGHQGNIAEMQTVTYTDSTKTVIQSVKSELTGIDGTPFFTTDSQEVIDSYHFNNFFYRQSQIDGNYYNTYGSYVFFSYTQNAVVHNILVTNKILAAKTI